MAYLGKTRREALTEFRQAEILEAARKVFAQRGFREAALDSIAAEAGIAKGTLYLYFSSKEEIFIAAVRERVNDLIEHTRRRLEELAGASAIEKIRAAIHVRFEFLRKNRDFLRIYFTEFGSLCTHPGQFQQESRELHIRNAQVLEPVFADGVRNGELRDVPPFETAMALTELTRGMIALHLLGIHQHSFDLEEFVAQLFLNGVAAPRADAQGGRG